MKMGSDKFDTRFQLRMRDYKTTKIETKPAFVSIKQHVHPLKCRNIYELNW